MSVPKGPPALAVGVPVVALALAVDELLVRVGELVEGCDACVAHGQCSNPDQRSNARVTCGCWARRIHVGDRHPSRSARAPRKERRIVVLCLHLPRPVRSTPLRTPSPRRCTTHKGACGRSTNLTNVGERHVALLHLRGPHPPGEARADTGAEAAVLAKGRHDGGNVVHAAVHARDHEREAAALRLARQRQMLAVPPGGAEQW